VHHGIGSGAGSITGNFWKGNNNMMVTETGTSVAVLAAVSGDC